jgi:hypothetical protein
MKTPMESMNRDLIEREMKIRMLENSRSHRQTRVCSDSKPKLKAKVSLAIS